MDTATKKFTKELPVMLNASELKDRSNELALEIESYDAHEVHRKAEAKRLKEITDEKNAEIRRLADIVKTGQEPREVDCRWEPNHQDKTMELWRLDDGSLVRTRPMDKMEVQKYLNGDMFLSGPPRAEVPEDNN